MSRLQPCCFAMAAACFAELHGLAEDPLEIIQSNFCVHPSAQHCIQMGFQWGKPPQQQR